MAKLKTHAFHILTALSERDSHGSGIARRVEEMSDGSVHLWPVTLYSKLDDLVAEGLIAELADEDERPAGASRRRRYYRLTRAGANALRVEAERLESIARLARRNVEDGSWGS